MPGPTLFDGYLDDYVPDCPVQPDVWRAYRETPSGESCNLLTQVRVGQSAPLVASLLKGWFEPTELLVHANYILVDATFDEMITALLPLTKWRPFVARAAALTKRQLGAEVTAVTSRRPLFDRTEGGVDWGAGDRARLRWLVEMVRRVYDPEGVESDTEATTRMHALMSRTKQKAVKSERSPLASVGLNRRARPAVCDSRKTVKVDAAERLFAVDCSDITWAIVDTGVDRTHPAFATSAPRGNRIRATFDVAAGIEALKDQHFDVRPAFIGLLDDHGWTTFSAGARVSDVGARAGRAADPRTEHGTHVAGILAANWKEPRGGWPRAGLLEELPEGNFRGVAPGIHLVDIRVFDEEEAASEFNVIVALAFIRWLNEGQHLEPSGYIDGVNISLSVPFAIDNHACGWTPVCQECDRLVKSGVVVVVSAGNAGFAPDATESIGSGFALVSISDPGNAEAVITVGSTHSHEPHRYGATSRSARGPTADGRHKPDLLAPGIDILGPAPDAGLQRLSGTSMAAPHVSGVAAMLLARFPELRGQPERVKQILCDTAIDLGRLPDFQGSGLLDALRALQSH